MHIPTESIVKFVFLSEKKNDGTQGDHLREKREAKVCHARTAAKVVESQWRNVIWPNLTTIQLYYRGYLLLWSSPGSSGCPLEKSKLCRCLSRARTDTHTCLHRCTYAHHRNLFRRNPSPECKKGGTANNGVSSETGSCSGWIDGTNPGVVKSRDVDAIKENEAGVWEGPLFEHTNVEHEGFQPSDPTLIIRRLIRVAEVWAAPARDLRAI